MQGLIKRGTRLHRIRPVFLIVATGMTALAPADSEAQQPVGNDWIGKRVVPKYQDFRLKIENQVIDLKRRIETYRVEQVNGPWLRLYANQLNGWATADQVVPVEQAIEFFTNYIRSNPDDAHGYSMRGFIWRKERRALDIALRDYNEAIRLDPASAHAYCNRGLAWHEKKEYDKAIADYNEAIRLDPKYALAYNNRGFTRHDTKEYDKAIADYIEAIRLDPKYAVAYRNRGDTWRNKRDYDKAAADYTEAIRLDPKSAEAHGNRAWLWATCPVAKYRDGKRAVQSATKACELLKWQEPIGPAILAAAYAEVGDFDAAVKWQSKAITLLSDNKTKEDFRSRLKLYQQKKAYREIKP